MAVHAACYTGNRTIEHCTVEPGTLGPGDVEIAVAFTGICGTDLHILHGDMDSRVHLPAILGHEMSGRIAAVGTGVDTTPWDVGQPVTVLPVISCGECPACRAGYRHICHRLNFVGIDSPGSMQSRWIVPANLLVALPAGLPLDHGALVEPTAVAVHDVRRSGLTAGHHAVVVGGGPVGLLIAVVARRQGANVLLVEPDAYRRSVAESVGLRALDPSSDDVVAVVTEVTAGAGADVAFEVSGAAAGVGTAVDVLATRGRLVLVAIHSTPREINLHRFFWRELELLGARLYDRSDMEEAVVLIAEGAIPVSTLISRIEPLSSAARAFGALDSGSGVMKVLVDCGE